MKWKLTLPSPSLLTLLLLPPSLLLLFTCSNEMRNNALKLHFNECEEAGSVLGRRCREGGTEREGEREGEGDRQEGKVKGKYSAG